MVCYGISGVVNSNRSRGVVTADQVKLTTNARATSTAALNCEKTFTSDSNGRLFSRQFSKYKLDSIL